MKRLHTISQRPAHTLGCGSQPLLVMSGIADTNTSTTIRSNTKQGRQHWSNLMRRCQGLGLVQQLFGLKSINGGFDYQLDASAILGAVEPEHLRWSGWCRISLTPM
jgi:hypothetical protein